MGKKRIYQSDGRSDVSRHACAPESAPRGRVRAWRAADKDVLRSTERAFAKTVEGGAALYDRARVLPRLIAIDPREAASGGAALAAKIRERLRRALRAERARGRAGHWAYDLNRHLALAQALAAEEALSKPDAGQRKTPPGGPDGVSKQS